MSEVNFSEDDISRVIDFHGHFCPGLAMGIQVAAAVLEDFDSSSPMMAVVENDMCAVDAIQYFTSCTFGKGMLKYLDYGKIAFSFFQKKTGQGKRYFLIAGVMDEVNNASEFSRLRRLVQQGNPSASMLEEYNVAREASARQLLEYPFNELFTTGEPEYAMPRGPLITESLVCASCGEAVMETRTRRSEGAVYCIPCFQGT